MGLPDEVVASFEADLRPVAEVLHALVLEGLPDASTAVAGGMITYSIGVPPHQMAALAQRKDGLRLYLTPVYEHPDLLERHRASLAGLMVGKSCLRLRLTDHVPRVAVLDVLREGAARRT